MRQTIGRRVHLLFERIFPEKRLFLRSDTETRFIRLRSSTQLFGAIGVAAVLSWTLIASAILLMDSLSAGSLREQTAREQTLYEERLNAISEERDLRAAEAVAAQQRFNTALEQVSEMQTRLLASEERRKEHETGINVIQETLRASLVERDAARDEAERLRALLEQDEAAEQAERLLVADLTGTLEVMSDALAATAGQRDAAAQLALAAAQDIENMELDQRLANERTDRIFDQIEDAVAVSLTPLDEMFRSAGLPSDAIIEQLRRTYSGQGGPLTPLTLSTKGDDPAAPQSRRANEVLKRLDELNLYRIAAEKTPFAVPVQSAFRFTSGFGPRWGRMHNGTDFASSYGTPIYSTADGVVTHAGWLSGYGRLIKIQHEFGIETRYAHLAKIRVKKGQRVSRGERIGDMGNSGRSTGTHLHYEVRENGKPVNPMTYIKAARDVF